MEDHNKHEHKDQDIRGHQHHDADAASVKPERPPVNSKKSLITVLVIVGIVIIVLATVVLLSKYVFTNKNSDTVAYNNYVFQKFEGNKWMTQQMIKGQLYNIPFYYNPTEVLDIPIDPASINKIRNLSYYSNVMVYVSVDPNESSKVVLAGVEYVRILGKAYDIYNMNVTSAINKPANQTTEYPVITCKNQSINRLVIYQTISTKNLVSIKGNCITIEASSVNETVRVADAFAFKLLNIIPLNQ
jgi:hypothetical protein